MMFPDVSEIELGGSSAERVVTVLTKWLRLVTELTMTMMASFLLDSGSSVMKSMLVVSQGAFGIGRG